MIEKNRLIELIQETNQSSTREWLEQFNQEDLRLYLDHLDITREPRGGGSRMAPHPIRLPTLRSGAPRGL